MGISNEGYAEYLSYLDQQGRLNGVQRQGAAMNFSVNPAIQQKLEKAKMESSPFLSQINSFGVVDQEGDKVSIAIKGPLASTNTSTTDRRNPSHVADEDSSQYRCTQTNWDTAIPYTYLDAWAGHPEIQPMISQLIAQQEANDRLMIGFNGIKRAAKSDKQNNPLLQDVNIGWLQHLRSKAAQRVMSDVSVTSRDEDGKIVEKGTYATLDSMVYDAKTSLLDSWHRNAPGLIAITGSNLFTQKNFKIMNQHSEQNPNMEMLAGNELLSLSSLGGLPVMQVPYFPDGAILLTTFKNLSVYWQKGKYRRVIQDEPQYNRVATYSSGNEGYVIEDYGLSCLIEGIHYAQ
ncbi:MAG: phage major capsid protein, P2 family [Providencia heimbachae]|nr:phage major capsid protein, P2 family [Providencia heimbachae]